MPSNQYYRASCHHTHEIKVCLLALSSKAVEQQKCWVNLKVQGRGGIGQTCHRGYLRMKEWLLELLQNFNQWLLATMVALTSIKAHMTMHNRTIGEDYIPVHH